VLLQLRVFYAREQPWTPIIVIIVVTAVKVIASLAAPSLTDDPDLVAGYLGLANGLGFLAGAVVGYVLLRSNLRPPGGRMLDVQVIRTILVTTAASLLAGLLAYVVDRLFGLDSLTVNGGGLGSLLRLAVMGVIMVPVIAGVLLAAKVPEATAAIGLVRRRLGGRRSVSAPSITRPDQARSGGPFPYSDHRSARPVRQGRGPATGWNGPPVRGTSVHGAGAEIWKGPAVSDDSAGDSAVPPDSASTTKISRPTADDFQPDVAEDRSATTEMPMSGRPPADYGGDPTRESLPFDAPREPPIEAATSDEDVHLIPGATIAGGRYRLLVFHGGPPNLQFWQALDTALDRQVALTFVDPDATLPDDRVQQILARTLKLSRLDMPGVARVLDVANTGSGGLIVSEWIRGGSLAEVAATTPSPIGGARAMQSLAAAAEAAHRAGVALSIDHPSRVRVSIEGDVALAFPATMPDASPEDDIRGIGAALYALLVNRWPLPETGEPSGLAPADLDPAGNPVEPRAVDREIPFQISAAAARAVQPDGGIRSAPTLLNLLQQATAVADRTDLISPVDRPDTPAPSRFRGGPDEDPEARARRKRGLMVGLTVGGVIVVVALIVLATVLSRIFGDVGGGLDGDELGLNAPSTSAEADGGSPGAGNVVRPVRATVFSPDGGADSPDQAGNAIDGNSTTVWPTDTYSDPNPFPNFKNGVGLMLQLPQPTTLKSVDINVSSTGTSVQIRSSQSADPSTLDGTTAMTPSTPLKTGNNTIEISDASPTSYVLVWIDKLGTVGGESRTDVSEITLKGTS
jgi:putative peptidoglycan lipid II flippase